MGRKQMKDKQMAEGSKQGEDGWVEMDKLSNKKGRVKDGEMDE